MQLASNFVSDGSLKFKFVCKINNSLFCIATGILMAFTDQ